MAAECIVASLHVYTYIYIISCKNTIYGVYSVQRQLSYNYYVNKRMLCHAYLYIVYVEEM